MNDTLTTAQIVLVMAPFAALFTAMLVGFARHHLKTAGVL